MRAINMADPALIRLKKNLQELLLVRRSTLPGSTKLDKIKTLSWKLYFLIKTKSCSVTKLIISQCHRNVNIVNIRSC